MRSRFGLRLLALYVLCSLFPTVILAYISLGAASRQLERQGVERLRQTAGILRAAILKRADLVADDLAGVPDSVMPCSTGSPAGPACDGSLLYGVSGLTLHRPDRSPVAIFGDPVPLPALGETERADLSAGRSVLLDRRDGQDLAVLLLRRTRSGNLLAGRLVADYLWGARAETPLTSSMVFHVVDDSSRLVSTDAPDDGATFPDGTGLGTATAGPRALVWKSGLARFLAVAGPILPSPGVSAPRWTVIVSDSLDAVLAPMEDFKRSFLVVALLGIGVAAFLAISQLKRSLSPLRALHMGTRRLADQMFSEPVVVTSGDEFAELAASFNTMSDQIARQFATEKASAAIDRAILSSVETREIVLAALCGVRQASRSDGVAIALVDRLDPAAITAYHLASNETLVIDRIRPGQTMAADSRPPIPADMEDLIVPAASAPSWLPQRLLVGVPQVLLLPLRSQGVVQGCIAIADNAGPGPKDELGPRLVRIAGQTALALANARMVEQIFHLAFFDNLTGLPNRVSFKRRLTDELSRIGEGGRLAVFFLDLDHFSRINDTLGHKTGDRLIQEVAHRLESCCRIHAPDAAMVARLGGDEFTVLLPEGAGPSKATDLAEAILECLREMFTLEGHETFVSASIGIALAPADGADLECLLKNADSAMYHAKRQGRGRFALYATSQGASMSKRLRLENHLRKALDAGEFDVAYQPIADVATGRIVAAEALIRWNHPEWGVVPPAEFIPVCEESGLIGAIGEWMLNAVCRQLRSWESKGIPIVPVAVNLSPGQFRNGRIVETIQRALDDSGLNPQYLGLELTESVLMEGASDTLKTLHALAAMGMSLAIDDFGTGYSSLSYLKQFPAHSVKIDRSFIRDVITNPDDVAITSAIVSMGKALNLRIVAEGVEGIEQLDLLRRLGCDRVQGYLIGRPAPADRFIAYLNPAGPVGGEARLPASTVMNIRPALTH